MNPQTVEGSQLLSEAFQTTQRSGRDLRVCSRCVMDTTDPGIEFDERGVCSRCRHYELHSARELLPIKMRGQALAALVDKIKNDGRAKKYDCIIGVSGGVDSTYVAYLVKSLGLRPLAIHLDNGWDSNIAVTNIEVTLKALSIELYTHVLDWEEFRDLQLAFLRASTPDCEIPSDHAIFALLYHQAARLDVKYIMFGGNTTTEGLAVPDWSSGHYDWRYIRAIHDKFGQVKLRSYIHLSLLNMFWFRYVRRIRQVNLLNYIDYNKEAALATITTQLGWKSYGGKHHESIYTRFYQSYILPKKFKADKRKAHLSALIMSGQIDRTSAMCELERPICPEPEVELDKIYVCKKLGITNVDLEGLLDEAPKSFWQYNSYEKSLLLRAYRVVRPARNPPPKRG